MNHKLFYVLVQMLATEIQRLAAERERGTTAETILRVLHGLSRGYLQPRMEIGVALPPRWDMWLSALETDVQNTARSLDDAMPVAEDDGVTLMGFPAKKGGGRKRGRDDDEYRRRRTRTSATSTPQAPWREGRNVAHAKEKTDRTARASTSTRTFPTGSFYHCSRCSEC